MPDFRVSIMYEHAGLGASETYIIGGATYSQIPGRTIGLVAGRLEFLPESYTVIGVRVADMAIRRSSYLYLPGEAIVIGTGGNPVRIPASGAYVNEATGGAIAHIRHTADVEFGWSDSRRTTRYFSGVPLHVLAAEPSVLTLDAAPKWRDAFRAFLNAVSSYDPNQPKSPNVPACSVLARTPSTAANTFGVIRWSLQSADPALLGLTIDTTPNPGIVAGSWVWIRGTRLQMVTAGVKARLGISLNGQWQVDSVVLPATGGTSYTYYLKGSAGIQPAWVKQPGTVQLRSSSVIPLNYYSVRRAGIHQRGKPPGLPRGRRSTLPLLDP